MSQHVYVAGRYDEREKIRSVMHEVASHGHSITRDWTTHLPIARYGEDPSLSTQYAKEDLDGVAAAEVFVLMTSELSGGTGIHAELGNAIARHELTGKPHVFVVGPHFSKSMMYFHPSVKRVDDLDEVLREIAGTIGSENRAAA